MYILLIKCTLAVYIEECGNFFVTRYNKKSVSFIQCVYALECWMLVVFCLFLLFPPKRCKHAFLKLHFFLFPNLYNTSQQLSGHTIILIRRKIHAGKAIGYVDMTTLFFLLRLQGVFFPLRLQGVYCDYRGYIAFVGGISAIAFIGGLSTIYCICRRYMLSIVFVSFLIQMVSFIFFYFPEPRFITK